MRDEAGASRGRRARAVAVITAIAAAGPVVAIVVVVLAGLAWTGYDPVARTQSELGAVDSPVRWWVNLGSFGLLGVALLAFAAVYLLGLRPSAWRTVGVVLLAAAGTGMVAVAFAPCDPGCVDVTSTGRWHSALSAPAAIALPAAMMVTSRAFRADGRFSRRWQVASFVLGGILLVSGPLIALELVGPVVGVVQRAVMWTAAIWVTVLTVRLSTVSRSAARGAPSASLGG